jgi:hypothetical protein
MKSRTALFTSAIAALAAGQAGAAVIYSNGPTTGNFNAFLIYSGSAVADSFTAGPGAVADGMTFETWSASYFSPTSVQWSIYNGNPLGGGAFSLLNSGTAAVSAVSLGSNGHGFPLWGDTISFGNTPLTCGSNCWVELKGAVGGFLIGWDDNGGPSVGWQYGFGDLSGFGGGGYGSNSETFSILGAIVPEPENWTLMLVGFAGLGAALRGSRARPATA